MSLRVIGGEFRNRPLVAPKGTATRPTLAIMRKAVFDICQSSIDGASFLDLFAGSGAMGIEALSRGATFATFIESNRLAIQCIQTNLKSLKLEDRADLLMSDVFVSLKKLAKQGKAFTIIYIDPPYALSSKSALLIELIAFLNRENLLEPLATLFIEEAAPQHLDIATIEHNGLKHLNSRTFSQSVLHQFRVQHSK